VRRLKIPPAATFEALAYLIFNKAATSGNNRLALPEILRFCETDPAAASWVAYFDDLHVRVCVCVCMCLFCMPCSSGEDASGRSASPTVFRDDRETAG
jgi:hypothetical protein